VDFANGTESVIKQVTDEGFQLPRHIRTIYRLSGKQATLIEERATRPLSLLSIERAPP